MQLKGQHGARLGLCPFPARGSITQQMWLSKLHQQEGAAAL